MPGGGGQGIPSDSRPRETGRGARNVPVHIGSAPTFTSEERETMGLLDGKAAIVTGSARGIGRATAELFVAEGAKVLINDLDADVAEQTASEIDGETLVFGGDLTKPGICDQLVEKVISEWGKVDILVH